jgi:hypothetical protein
MNQVRALEHAVSAQVPDSSKINTASTARFRDVPQLLDAIIAAQKLAQRRRRHAKSRSENVRRSRQRQRSRLLPHFLNNAVNQRSHRKTPFSRTEIRFPRRQRGLFGGNFSFDDRVLRLYSATGLNQFAMEAGFVVAGVRYRRLADGSSAAVRLESSSAMILSPIRRSWDAS